MGQRHNQQVCFIAGAGHSGSTLLGLILGSHSAVFYGGEIKKYQSGPKRLCRRCGPDCSIWSALATTAAPDLYEALSLASGRATIVDSAKNTEWIAQQSAIVAAQGGQPTLLFLQRDGRAVLNSRRRKRPDIPATVQIARWQAQIEQTCRLYDTFPGTKSQGAVRGVGFGA